MFASITAFGDLAGTLVGLQRGDTACVVGNVKLSTYTAKAGSTKAGISVTDSRIVALVDAKAPPKAPRPKGNNGQRRRTADTQAGPRKLTPDEFTDNIPF